LLEDGEPCSSANDCASGKCTKFYTDADKDGYGKKVDYRCGTSAPSGTATNSSDCCDSDANAKPGQTEYFTTPRKGCGGYDYNCDGSKELEYTNVNPCVCTANGPFPVGWLGPVPDCGGTQRYGICGYFGPGHCGPQPDAGDRTQACR
jgi:hypothetical protein